MSRILIIGNFDFEQYEESTCKSLEKLNHEVYRFKLSGAYKNPIGRIEYYFVLRSITSLFLSLKLLFLLKFKKVDVAIFWRTILLFDFVLKVAKLMGVKIVSYNNDDPFSPLYPTGNCHQKRLWTNFKRQIKYFDINLVYRPVNIQEYKEKFGVNVKLWLPSFDLSLLNNIEPKYCTRTVDVLFVGHWTEEREDICQYLCDNNIRLQVFGSGWNNSKSFSNARHLNLSEYYSYLKSCKIALGFLSKLNRDVYTRRNFEIPASGAYMLSEHSEYLEEIFRNFQKVDFFNDKHDCLKKVKIILENYNSLRLDSGDQEFFSKQHSVDTRTQELLAHIEL
jgi:spore maturation protein CgeB